MQSNMIFTYSICDPLEKEIISISKNFKGEELLQIAKNYPWMEKLNIMEQLKPEEIYYNPSLDFLNVISKSSFGLSAHFNDQQELEFSLWYRRPKKNNVFFGLFGEKEKMVVDDKWGYNLEASLIYLNDFIDGNDEKLEQLFT